MTTFFKYLEILIMIGGLINNNFNLIRLELYIFLILKINAKFLNITYRFLNAESQTFLDSGLVKP